MFSLYGGSTAQFGVVHCCMAHDEAGEEDDEEEEEDTFTSWLQLLGNPPVPWINFQPAASRIASSNGV